MIVALSPAKRLRQEDRFIPTKPRPPLFHEHALPLIKKLSKMSKPALIDLMSISQKLALENQERYRTFSEDPNVGNLHEAIHTFYGEVYWGLESESLTAADLEFADKHMRILSGLYGYLRPLDAIQPYRLEMGTNISVQRKKNLYEYWKNPLKHAIETDLNNLKSEYIIDLASNEYFTAVETANPSCKIIHINFKEYRNDQLKTIQFNLKRARGYMTRFIIENRVTDPELIKGFDAEGYVFAPEYSTKKEWLFIK